MALTLLKEPGALGAGIAVGSMQRFGVPMGYGGPHAAYVAGRDTFKRALPGGIVGLSVDSQGNRAHNLALRTREQHIRREKATSNTCTAQALLAVMASFYAVFHGPDGLKAVAQRIHAMTVRLARRLEAAGFEVEPGQFFDTITVDVGLMQRGLLQAAVREGVNLRRIGRTKVGMTLDERTLPETLEAVWRAFCIEARGAEDRIPEFRLPSDLLRQTPYLRQEVFRMNRSEQEMTRYMRRLADRDLALDRAMIPLGSCTMKLNASVEMMPIGWRDFSLIHPFAPADQARGYAETIAYPSTHGVFEETVRGICGITREQGGQVHIDGADMNGMVGLSRPGDLGGDVSHLNLHKTFCIPHGGGGPGMGPIGVKARLAPHLPGHPQTGGENPVAGTPFGSASLLPTSWACDMFYRGRTGRVAHECILDTRPFEQSAGVTVEDVAKRLMDCGFHAPAMSWPGAGTRMVEPTEGENKAELDRFCDAMLAIRAEIAEIEAGRTDRENNPLKQAPHTMEDLVRDWDRPYSREQGCFPPGAFRVDKHWPPVNRVDNARGDRHLVCTCPPMSDHAQAAE